MGRMVIAVIAAGLLTFGNVAAAQVGSDLPDDSTFSDAKVMGSTPVTPVTSHSIFDDPSVMDSMARYPMSRDPMSRPPLKSDTFSDMPFDGWVVRPSQGGK